MTEKTQSHRQTDPEPTPAITTYTPITDAGEPARSDDQSQKPTSATKRGPYTEE